MKNELIKSKFINKNNIGKYMALFILLGVALLLPQFITSNYLISVFINCFIYASLGIAWNIISGYGGQVSWCHSAFVAIGGYTGILLYNNYGISPFLSIPVAMLISLVVASIIGSVSFRYRGPFFAITTIAFAEIVRVLLLHFVDFTGGSRGISVRFTSPSFINLMFRNDIPFFYIMLVGVIIMVMITMWFEKSKTGYYLKAIKNDEDAAISLGIRTSKVKLSAFQLSAMLTSVLGIILAFYMTYIEPQSISGLDISIKIGSIAIVGGVGTVLGPVLGAFVIIPLIELANIILGSSGGSQLLYGLALILVVLVEPRGIATLFSKDSILPATFNKLFKKSQRKKPKE